MANVQVIDGASATKYMKATGDGTDSASAFMPHQIITDEIDSVAVTSGSRLTTESTITDGTDSVTVTSSSQLNINIDAQTADLTIADGGNSITVDQSTHDNLNLNANLQQGDADLSITNPAFVKLSDGTDSVVVDSASQLLVLVDNNDLISTNNSTTTPLGISASYTGTGDDCEGFSSVTITLYADEASAASGMQFEFSTDNSNWDDTYTFTMSASTTRRFQFPVTAQYFRVHYENGTTAQTAFRVQTILHKQYVGNTVHRLADDVSSDRSVTLVKSAIIAQQAGAGDFIAIQSTAGGNLKVAVEEFDAALPSGTNDIGNVVLTDTTDTVSVTSSSQLNVNIDAQTNDINIADGGNSLTVDAALGSELHTKLSDGTDTAAITSSSHLQIEIASDTVGIGGGQQYEVNEALGATASGTLAIYSRDDALSNLTPVEGDAIEGRVDSRGALWVNVANSTGGSAVNIQDGGNSLTVDQSAHDNLNVNANLQQGDADISLTNPTFVKLSDGTDSVIVNSSSYLSVVIAQDDVGIGGGTQYTEDNASPGTFVGNALMMIRRDTPATVVSTDGDIIGARATNYGAQYVQVVDSSGNFINSFGGSGGTAINDDSAFTPATDQVTPVGYFFDDVSTDSVNEGDVGVARMTGNRLALGVISDAANEHRAVVNSASRLTTDARLTDGVDTVSVNSSSRLAVVIEQDDVGIGGGTQYVEDAAFGGNGTGTLMIARRDDALSNLTPVADDAVGLRVDSTGALWVNVANSTSGSAVNIQDGGNDISIDWAGTAPPIGAGTEAAALRVTVATDSTGVLSVDDNGGALTVDQTTHDNLNLNANLQQGDADISITNPTFVKLSDATDSVSVNSSSQLSVVIFDGGDSHTVDGTVTVTQGTHDNLNLNANLQQGDADLSITNPTFAKLSDATDSVAVTSGSRLQTEAQLSDGTDTVSVNSSSQLAVEIFDGGDSHTVDQATHDNLNANANLQVGDADNSLTNQAFAQLSDGTDGAVIHTGSALWVTQKPFTASGLDIFRSIDLDETEEQVKGSAGQIYGWYIYNTNVTASNFRYVKFYNATCATAVVGSTTPVLTIPIGGNQGANVEFNNGIEFATAITVAATTGVADNDTGAPAANEIIVNIFYK